MKPATLVTALATGTALVGAGVWMMRREAPRALGPSYIPIVTPIIDMPFAAVRSIAGQYSDAVRDFLRDTLRHRRAQTSSVDVERAMATFLGDHAPHDWPIGRDQVEQLGLPVAPAPFAFAQLVDRHRRSW